MPSFLTPSLHLFSCPFSFLSLFLTTSSSLFFHFGSEVVEKGKEKKEKRANPPFPSSPI